MIERYLRDVATMQTAATLSRAPGGWAYNSCEDFVLRAGRDFPLVERAERALRGKRKECFANATKLVLAEPERYVYVEGYALSVIPILHAWVWDRERARALEVAWPLLGGAYRGVAFNRDYLFATILKRRKYGLIDAWERRFPLLSGEDALEGAIERLEGDDAAGGDLSAE